MFAVFNKHEGVVKVLTLCGRYEFININHQDKIELSALTIAVEILRCLDIKINSIDNRKKTALSITVEKGYKK